MVTLNPTSFRRQVRAFTEVHGPRAAQEAAKKVAEAVLVETIAGIEGRAAPLPERVRTGRYVAAWKAQLAALRVTGNLRAKAAVENTVPYSVDIEYGSRTLAPGGHLRRAVRIVGKNLPKIVAPLFQKAWKQVK